MSKKTFYMLIAVSMVAVPGFSAKERVIRVQNTVRVGYDDNIYLQKNAQSSAFITDILNLTGKFHISGRTDALLYWQPEVRYRFDADPKTITYQDLYAKLDHALSQRTFLTISDRFRYQQKDGQSGAGISTTDQNFVENDLMGALNVDVGELSMINVGAGYNLRKWDDASYGAGSNNNDYDRYQVNGSYLRQLNQNKTTGVLEANYTDLAYEGARGGYQGVSLIGGVDQNFNPNLSGFGRLGGTMATVDNASGSSDSTSPYLDFGLTYKPSERTSIDGSTGYKLNQSENSIYNAQDEFNVRLGVRHDLTAKINIASTLAAIHSMYKSDYQIKGLAGDADDTWMRFNIRGSYQINRNNFIELGYGYSKRWISASSLLSEYDRNQIDIGWRLRL